MKRSSGILLPVSSLPSPGGIGTFGREAYEFVDFLNAAGQRYWQLLPLGPTSYGDSPYQSFSAYAGNPYFVDPSLLVEEGLLTKEEFFENAPADCASVDYAAVYETRFALLETACARGIRRDAGDFSRFCEENAPWLADYALFMALKRHFGMRSWTAWEDDDIRFRKPEAVRRYQTLLSREIEFISYQQYKFFQQYYALRDYAHKKGVRILGDLPIYVAMDSADVWADPENFLLDENLQPAAVAGVPPDHFSKTGQLWGNPLYRWEDMKKDGYAWWKARIRGAARLYDAIRIDHFRGFESYWSVDAGETSAMNGSWVKGPGSEFVKALCGEVHGMEIIAEDLGYLDENVRELLRGSGLPGMKVLEFAFDSREPGDYLPHTYPQNCVCYVGTHDNAPVMAWRREAAPEDVAFAEEYLGLNGEEGFNFGMIRGGMSSVAALFVAQMQDYLGLGADARTNTPSTLGGNWKWRMEKDALRTSLAQKIRRMCYIYGRLGAP
ncbi:MAG: 4-alpha-glucanotransferase [Clostridiaceae bacterium]|nr:4-alpha-glucanotransferase [Eubacteriales bacterium]